MAAERININPLDCYVFEDSIQGLEAGIASGATVIGLTTSNPSEKLKNKAHKLIDNFVDFSIEEMLSTVKS